MVKPPPFAYVDPHTSAEALHVLGQHADEAKLLAGGQSLVPLLNMRLAQPRVVIDLNRVSELNYITPRSLGHVNGCAFGAMTRQRAVEDSVEVLMRLPLLREAIGWIGHQQIRNRGTVGGSIAHADPAAELPLVFRTLDGTAIVRSEKGERAIPSSEFFVYTFSPAVDQDEMLVDVWLPFALPRTGQAFIEIARRHGDFAMVAVAASLTLDEDAHCADVRIGVGGAAPVPMRATEAEDMVRGHKANLETFREAGRIVAATVDPTTDVHADADYRRDVAGTLTARALTLAFERAGRDDA